MTLVSDDQGKCIGLHQGCCEAAKVRPKRAGSSFALLQLVFTHTEDGVLLAGGE
jgi:hypothetical protein